MRLQMATLHPGKLHKLETDSRTTPDASPASSPPASSVRFEKASPTESIPLETSLSSWQPDRTGGAPTVAFSVLFIKRRFSFFPRILCGAACGTPMLFCSLFRYGCSCCLMTKSCTKIGGCAGIPSAASQAQRPRPHEQTRENHGHQKYRLERSTQTRPSTSSGPHTPVPMDRSCGACRGMNGATNKSKIRDRSDPPHHREKWS